METLAADLREATSEWLDVPRSKAGNAGQQQPPSTSYSPSSRLKVLKDPPLHQEPRAIRTPSPLAAGKVNRDTASRSSSPVITDSLRSPPTGWRSDSTDGTPLLQASPGPGRRSKTKTPASKSDLFARATSSPVGNSRLDIWLNEKGEKVVNGQVVGKLSVGAQSRGRRGSSSRTDTGDAAGTDADIALASDHDEGEDQWPSDQAADGSALGGLGISSLDTHGNAARNKTPSFFRETFLITRSREAPEQESDAVDIDPPATSVEPSASEAREPAETASIVSSSPQFHSPVSSPPSSMRRHSLGKVAAVKMARPPDVADESVERGGDRSNNFSATVLTTDSNSVPERQTWKSSVLQRGIAWQAREAPGSSGSTSRARPFFETATSLFNTQLIGSEAAADSTEGQATETDLIADGSIEEILGSPNQDDRDSASSLFSLPASSIAGPQSDAGSRRASLKRTDSAASAGSTSSRHSRSGSFSGTVFTRDVRVRGWSEVGGRTRGFVTFEIVILTRKGVTIRAHRRYSAFVALRAQLVNEAAQHREALPKLPPKDAFHKYSAKHLEQRRIALTEWLQAVMLDSRWGGRRATREWLVGAA